MDKSMNCGVAFDKMKYIPLQWKHLTLWGVPDPKHKDSFIEFQVFSLRRNLTYRCQALVPSSKSHPSGWNLDIIRFGDKKPVSKIANHELLKTVDFAELFAILGVLVDEEENPNLFEYISKKELARMKRKWIRWKNDLPDWIQPTINATNARLATANTTK